MAIGHSPLRYPGGKQALARVLSRLMEMNGVHGGTYIEPYAGGAGAAICLLFGEHVKRIHINDADPCIHAFWYSVLEHTDKFVGLLMQTETTVDEWTKQRAIYLDQPNHSALEVGFATFYLNRCNRSGVIAGGGPIGGKRQTGAWKIDARFNRQELARRICRIALYRDRIALSQLDGIQLLTDVVAQMPASDRPFVYLDPPYFAKGRDLYLNYYRAEDHFRLATYLREQAGFPWVLSYDNVNEIRDLYAGLRQIDLSFDYSAGIRRVGKEILILQPGLEFPAAWDKAIPRGLVSATYRREIPLGT